jgi:hypothetical protein
MTRARWLVISMTAALGTAVLAGSVVSGCEASAFDEGDGPVIAGPESPPFNGSTPGQPAPGGGDAGVPTGDGGTNDGGRPPGDGGLPAGDAGPIRDANPFDGGSPIPGADAGL